MLRRVHRVPWVSTVPPAPPRVSHVWLVSTATLVVAHFVPGVNFLRFLRLAVARLVRRACTVLLVPLLVFRVALGNIVRRVRASVIHVSPVNIAIPPVLKVVRLVRRDNTVVQAGVPYVAFVPPDHIHKSKVAVVQLVPLDCTHRSPPLQYAPIVPEELIRVLRVHLSVSHVLLVKPPAPMAPHQAAIV